MTQARDTWQHHLEAMQREASTTVRADAFEVFMAEAARVRLIERSGSARVLLRSGAVIAGVLASPGDEPVEGQLVLTDPDGRQLLIPVTSVSALIGAPTALRDESPRPRPRSLGSRLRDCWAAGEPLRVLLLDGRWIAGAIALVASDHVELVVGDEHWVVPLSAGQAWDLGRSA